MRYRSPSLVMMSAGMMASVSGILMVSVVPRPCTEEISRLPPIFSTLVFTTSIPTPRPDTFVIAAAVEKPGRKIRFAVSRSDNWAARSAVMMPEEIAFSLMRP